VPCRYREGKAGGGERPGLVIDVTVGNPLVVMLNVVAVPNGNVTELALVNAGAWWR